MINHPKRFEVLLRDEEEDLEPILEWLLVREYVEIKTTQLPSQTKPHGTDSIHGSILTS